MSRTPRLLRRPGCRARMLYYILESDVTRPVVEDLAKKDSKVLCQVRVFGDLYHGILHIVPPTSSPPRSLSIRFTLPRRTFPLAIEGPSPW